MLTSVEAISRAFQLLCAWRVRAATPATCGDAIDVPESTAESLPVPTPTELMLTPGAETAGRRPLSPLRGPPEENEA